jgi:hypothetical protein
MSSADDWVKAYARQASADIYTHDQLALDESVPECHKLMFLQMACEKLVKAHLCAAGSEPKKLQSSHAYTAKTLPIIIKQQITFSRLNPKGAPWVLQHSRHLSQEIEVLAPAVDRDGQRPDNCEYPWEDSGGHLHHPLAWTFTPSNLLMAGAGRTFLKLVRDAIKRLQ